MAGFQAVAGALPNSYADILNAYQPTPALNDKVRVISVNPDGTPVSLGSIAAMYGNAYSDNGAHGSTALAPEGLTSHSVHTVPIDPFTGNPVKAGDSIIDRPVQVAGRTSPVSNENPLNMDNLGVTHDYFRTPAVAPGVSAIERAAPRNLASMFGPAYGDNTWGSGHLLDFSGAINTPGGEPAGGDPWAGSRIGGAPVGRPGLVTGGAPRAVAPPPTPVQNLASMFTPAAQPPLMSGDLYGANRGFGGENAQMPDSMNNSRWRTGY